MYHLDYQPELDEDICNEIHGQSVCIKLIPVGRVLIYLSFWYALMAFQLLHPLSLLCHGVPLSALSGHVPLVHLGKNSRIYIFENRKK